MTSASSTTLELLAPAPVRLQRLVRRFGLARAAEWAAAIDDMRRERWWKYLRDCRNGKTEGTIYDAESMRLKLRAVLAHWVACDLHDSANRVSNDIP
jgi:hypothetical protein